MKHKKMAQLLVAFTLIAPAVWAQDAEPTDDSKERLIRKARGLDEDNVMNRVLNLMVSQTVVLHDGRVTLCCMDYKHEAILGNVLDSTLEEIWHSRAFERVRARVRGDLPTDDQFICDRCEWHVSRAAMEPKSSEARRADRRATTGVEPQQVGV